MCEGYEEGARREGKGYSFIVILVVIILLAIRFLPRFPFIITIKTVIVLFPFSLSVSLSLL